MEKIKKGLTLIGLTNLEARVYLKLLELKQTKVGQLAKTVKVTRTQLYPLLEKLVEKGVLRKTGNSVTIYQVLDPDELMSLLETWKEKQMGVLRDFESEIQKLREKRKKSKH